VENPFSRATQGIPRYDLITEPAYIKNTDPSAGPPLTVFNGIKNCNAQKMIYLQRKKR
jgi:hypothetical protein